MLLLMNISFIMISAPSQWTNWGYPLYEHPMSRPFKPRSRCDVGYHWNSNTNQCEGIKIKYLYYFKKKKRLKHEKKIEQNH